jgi:hypothetical protein
LLELQEIGGGSCLPDIDRCIALILESDFEGSQIYSERLLELCWEQLHLGHWKDAFVEWRDLYSLSSLLWAYSACMILNYSHSLNLLLGATEIEDGDIIKKLDMALLMGGPLYHSFIHQMIKDLHRDVRYFVFILLIKSGMK